MADLYLWKKTVAVRHADAWQRKLDGTVPVDRLAVVAPVGGRTQSFQAYLDSEDAAHELKRRFGGTVREVKAEGWMPTAATRLGKPLAFGRSLLVTGHVAELLPLRAAHPRKHVLCIPAAMAFGTGDHATTAMCLRFLAQVAAGLSVQKSWRLLDLGTGSGVLALAARLFGAQKAVGYDNDPHAVRTARENAVLNGIDDVFFKQLDLLGRPWPKSVLSQWPVITANLFSELLIALLPQAVAALRDGGHLIASGILASQTPEVEAAMLAQGLRTITKSQRGRWVAYLTGKSA